MAGLSAEQESRSPIEAMLQWCRDLLRPAPMTELNCLGEEEVERIARDAGVSASELRTLARLGRDSANLLPKRMAALGLDQNEVSRTARRTLQDLQRLCALCQSHRRCARDLASDSRGPEWESYCPNAGTLMSLKESLGGTV